MAVVLLPIGLPGPETTASAQEPSPLRGQELVQAHDNTNFPLVGRHRTTECSDCHLQGVMAGTPRTCEQCHWVRRQDDRYQLALGMHCEECHTAQGWTRVISGAWDHELMTGFRLQGAHRAADCSECHGSSGFQAISSSCSTCHLEDHQQAREPDHVAAGFPTDCEFCHTSQSAWQGALQFEHSIFPLTGQHKTADCSECHIDGGFFGTPTGCSDCHIDDYRQTTNPNHQQAQFPTDCETCHASNANTWRGATTLEEHASFPLRGLHRTADCGDCHASGRYEGLHEDCVSCHRDDYNRTNHQQQGFSTDCQNCHGESATSWQGAKIQHSRFPLQGQHRTADCNDCHANGQYAGRPSQCLSCHQDDYNRTTHQQQGFSTNCENCHGESATSWQGATFEHTRFDLRGEHRTADCNACHGGGQYAGLPSQCVSCHQDDYNGTDHQQKGFSTDCESCHGTSATTWQGASFDHQRFELRGSHRAADCNACHGNGQYKGLPSQCEDCHIDDYNGTNHRQVGFSTDCESCHGNSATNWRDADFNHDRVFPLEGAHTRLDCDNCHHGSGSPPKDCFGCHAGDYQGAKNPDHVAASFPTSCDRCHFPSHSRWSQADFAHDFPITSGPHQVDCTECHLSSSYNQFSCTHCHKHEKNEMDDKHDEEAGYVYDSQACYGCHPSGRE